MSDGGSVAGYSAHSVAKNDFQLLIAELRQFLLLLASFCSTLNLLLLQESKILTLFDLQRIAPPANSDSSRRKSTVRQHLSSTCAYISGKKCFSAPGGHLEHNRVVPRKRTECGRVDDGSESFQDRAAAQHRLSQPQQATACCTAD